MLSSGTSVGRYVILDQLGEGAMGQVYRAWDNALDRVVALKMLLPMRADSPPAKKRFLREARLAARINHPSIAHVYDVGEHEESPFIAMEFVPGRQLRALMDQPLTPQRIVSFARQILDGLSEAHRQGVVHRDLKPENIMISGRDQVKILDFGLAKPVFDDTSEVGDLSTTGLTGTPRYMAPEQIQGHGVDARTDLYALGCVLYELCTGKPAHQGSTLGELLMAVVHKPAPELTPDLAPRALALAIKRALEKRPADRFADAQSMLDALVDLDASDEGPAPGRAATHVPHPRAEVYAKRGRESLTGIGNSSSIAAEMLERAIELDPDYALAFAVHAEACAAAFCTGQADARWLDRAQASLDRAEQLDPALPDLRVARARILWNKTFNFPAETALRELRLALKKAPNHRGALRMWATITAHLGLFDLTEAALVRLRALDPGDPFIIAIVAEMALARGEPERTLEVLAEPLRLDPKHEEVLHWWIQAHALAILGRLEAAESSLRALLRRHPEDPLALALASLLRAMRGDPRGARALATSSERSMKGELHPHHAYHLLACAESVLGDQTRALSWLERSCDEGMPCYPWFATDPFLAKLRADPEGAAFMEALKRRFDFFVREFPLVDKSAMSFLATEIPGP
ncbi:protein kinase [Myxococcota bacterium]|nr:protein kinase [Myxococcota bacterium]